MATAQELPIDTGASAIEMAEEIFGDGVTVVSANYFGDNQSSGIYSNGDSVSAETTPGDTGVILSTGNATEYTNSGTNSGTSSGNWGGWNGWNGWGNNGNNGNFGNNGNGNGGNWGGGGGTSTDTNQASNTSTNTSGVNNNADFNAAAGTNTYDASFLEIDFIPDGDTMTIQFVFSSEEYPEYVDSLYQDFIGVWVNDEFVELGLGDGDIDPNNINSGNNESLFISNLNDEYNTEMDGFTATMTLNMSVNAGEVNSIRIGIADVTDSSYDSNLLIAGGSIQTALIAQDDEINVALDGTQTVDVMANDDGPSGSTLTLTHINGQEVSAGSTVTLSTGQVLQVNADGTITVTADSDVESTTFSYTVESDTGVSDTAFATINQAPCFVAGTKIRTPDGAVPVDQLMPGDLVLTKDNGAQPVAWIGSREVEATGDYAPVRIARNTFGNHREIWVSPLHRVLVRDSLAELLFGTAEVLVAAKELVNGRSVRQIESDSVTYVHLMFDEHQIVWSEGLETESFLPGPQMNNSFERDTMAEICQLFPELDPDTGEGYGPAARRTLRGYEARLIAPVTEVA
ncbi:Hint domain-containing protein [Thalassovita sp.]|uniref:Hint domain-containing protein n=1 Tax=Thalassovita sp. TaxID=1979401 RepID=UPI002B26C4FE|nr:Hint domain-containing protein [Thalassovita sp.]